MGIKQLNFDIFEQIIDTTNLEIFIFDCRSNHILYLNDNLKQKINYHSNSISKLKLSDLLQKDNYKNLVEKNHKDKTSFILKFKIKNQISYEANFKLSYMKDSKKEIIIASSLNQSSENDYEHQIKEKEEFLRKVLDSIPGPIFCKDYSTMPGKFVFWNNMATTMWGLKESEVIGKSDFDFFPEDQASFFQSKDIEAIKTGTLQFIEKENVDTVNQGQRVVRTWKIPLKEDGKYKYLLGVSLDITELMALEEKYEEEKAKSLQASKLASLGEMAAGIAHEINNPLTIIHGLTRQIDKLIIKNKLNEETLIEKLTIMKRHSERIAKIVNGLRSFARDGSQDEFEAVNVDKMIENCLELCESQITSLGIKLKIDIDPNLPQILCQKIQFSQVIVNLLNNARYAASETQDKWIKIHAQSQNGFLDLFITDSGQGISEKNQEKLFNPFFTTKVDGEGTGLGLSISKGIIENHNGDLYYNTSSPNTQFVITMPIILAQSKTAS